MKKRAALRRAQTVSGSSSTEDNAAPDPFLLKHQNRALAGHIYQSKQTIARYEAQIKTLETQDRSMTALMSCVERHWQQLELNLSGLVPGPPAAAPPSPFASTFRQSLPLLLANITASPAREEGEEDEDGEEATSKEQSEQQQLLGSLPAVSAELAARVEFSTSLLSRVLRRLEESKQEAAELRTALSESSIDESLQAELARLTSALAESEERNAALSAAAASACCERDVACDRAAVLARSASECQSKLDTACEERDRLLRRLARQKEQMKEEGASKASTAATTTASAATTAGAAAATPAAPAAAASSSSTSASASASASSEATQQVREELEDARSLAASRQQELRRIRAEKVAVEQQLLQARRLIPENVTATPVYRQLSELYEKQRAHHAAALNRLSACQKQVEERSAALTAAQQKFAAAEKSIAATLERRSAAAEARVAKGEEERAKLRSQLSAAQAQARKRQRQGFAEAEFKKMAAGIKLDNRRYREGCDRARKQMARITVAVNAAALAGPAGALEKAREAMAKQAAAAAAAAAAAGGSGSGGKRPAAMNLKPGATGNVDTDMALTQLNKNLAAAAAAAEAGEQEREALLQEIEGVSTLYEEMQDTHTALLAQQSEREVANAKLVKEQLRLQQRLADNKLHTEELRRTEAQAEELARTQQQLLQRLERTQRRAVEIAGNADRAIVEAQAAAAEHKKQVEELQLSAQQLTAQQGATSRQLNTAAMQAAKLTQELSESQASCQQLTEELAKSRKKVERYKKRKREAAAAAAAAANGAGGAASGGSGGVGSGSKGGISASDRLLVMDAELRELKTRLRCSVCHDRFKDVVLTKCYHCFCKQCIDTNLKTRHRKCPACSRAFGADDVKSIWLS